MNIILTISILITSNLIMLYYYKREIKRHKSYIEGFVNDVHAKEHVYFQQIDDRIKKLEN